MQISKRYIGLMVCVLWLVVRYAFHLWHIRSFTGYKLVFLHFMPEWLVIVRYMFSFALRIVGIFICTGLLCLKERYRLALVFFCWFNILTIYLKHPYQTVYKGAEYIAQTFPIPGKFLMSLNLTQEQLTWAWVGYFSLEEIFVSATILFYITRPKVKKLFK